MRLHREVGVSNIVTSVQRLVDCVAQNDGLAGGKVCCSRSIHLSSVRKSFSCPLDIANLSGRFISPAVVQPELVDVEVPKDDSDVIRRGLKVIAKVIQNLANNIFFGKEQHMVPLNDFLHDNIVNVTRYLNDIVVSGFLFSCRLLFCLT